MHLVDVLLEETAIFDRLRGSLYEGEEDAFARNGIDIHHLYYLGRGSQGMAFSLGGHTALKLTHDAREAQTAAYLRDNPLRNVVRIHSVYLLTPEESTYLVGTIQNEYGPEMPGKPNTPVYAILQDELGPVPDSDAMRRASRFLKAAGIKTSFDLLDPLSHDATEAKVAASDLDRAAKGYAMWLISALVELGQAGLKFKDFHAGGGRAKGTGSPLSSNIMQDRNGPKLIDIGYTAPPETEQIGGLLVSQTSVRHNVWEFKDSGFSSYPKAST